MRLPEQQRITLVLNYYQKLSYKQIAETLNCSIGTVKTTMFRALKRLAVLLPDGGEGQI
jgi:RNA polymerase sigma factor (sigma-70 family)